MKYLFKPSDHDAIYGYDNLILLRIDLAQNPDPEGKFYRLKEGVLHAEYEPFKLFTAENPNEEG